ncbi:MalY/PatB family protein [Propionibacteriaceae bacterium G1746]|uniref:MalY/PatB family protein n=1 Tax=Aestuariimicrobium sp. G57 TaxID=3418485 RepID=UPI003C1D58F5
MRFDDITAEQLFALGGSKWSRFGDAYGAFVAEMDFGLAEPIRAALHKMVDDGLSGYISPVWDQKLREATTAFVERRYGWTVDPGNVLASPDVLTGLMVTMEHHIKPDARVILPTPAYMPFMFLPGKANHDLVQVPMIRTENEWLLDFDAIDEVFQDGDLFILCNPHNPIGKVYTRDEMQRLSEIVDKHHGRVFNDEIHAPLTMPGVEFVPYPMVNEVAAGHTLTAMSASKAWNLAGYKCAQLVLNDEDLSHSHKFAFDLHGTATPGMLSNIAAFNEGEEWLAGVNDYLAANQQRLIELLAEELPGAVFVPNQGTYLAWLDLEALELEGKPSDFFLEKARVALTDGGACGDIGKHSVRLNFGTPRPVMEEMVRRMGEAVRSR